MSATKTRRPRRTTLTDDQRAEKRAAERELVKQSIEALRTSEGWQAWIGSRRHFGRNASRSRSSERYPQHAPSDFDPAYAGECWDEDY